MKSASASCSSAGVPPSASAFSYVSAPVSHDGDSIQPSRSAGARRLLAEPMCATRSGASPCSAPTGVAVVAQLRVVVVLDDQRVLVLGPLEQRARRSERQHDAGRELVGRRDDDRPRTPTAASSSTSSPCSSTAIPTGSSPAASAISRCCGQPGSSTAIRSSPRARSARHSTEKPCGEAGADDRVLGLGRRASGPTEVGHQRVAQLGRAAGIAVAERVERRLAQRRSQRAQPLASRGNADEVGQARVEVVLRARRRASVAATGGRSRSPLETSATRVGAPWTAVR